MLTSLLPVSKSLWSYNPLPTGCVLYLPLWSPSLRGGNFNSVDPFRLAFVATGAFQKDKGYFFDGNDDQIKNTTPNFRSGDPSGAIAAWFRTTAGSDYLLTSSDEATATSFISFGLEATGELLWNQRNAGDAQDQIKGTAQNADGAWHLGIISSNGSRYLMNVDGASDAISVGAGADNGDWFADTTLRDNLVIGRLIRTISTGTWDDLIGEVWVWNYEPSLDEKKFLFERTKGRYT